MASEVTTELALLTPRARRARRLSLLALPVAAALALTAHSWESALEWWRTSDLTEKRVAKGEAAVYAGAEWRMAALTKVADRSDGAAWVMAEFEATVLDTEAFVRPPCTVVLADAAGRRWVPVFLPPREIRQKAGEKPNCGSATLDGPVAGTRLDMAEIFAVPSARLAEVGLVVSLPAGRPEFLRFE